jgi:hypothetical protein
MSHFVFWVPEEADERLQSLILEAEGRAHLIRVVREIDFWLARAPRDFGESRYESVRLGVVAPAAPGAADWVPENATPASRPARRLGNACGHGCGSAIDWTANVDVAQLQRTSSWEPLDPSRFASEPPVGAFATSADNRQPTNSSRQRSRKARPPFIGDR